MTKKILTIPAFEAYRATRVAKPIHPDAARFQGDVDPMSSDDGLAEWEDGPQSPDVGGSPPQVDAAPADRRLWVVTDGNVLHAPELCSFGACREAKALKHSNLTGGADAFAGGELLFVDDETIVVNGCSGRYRIHDARDMHAVASAFRRSGYKVWSMGFNNDTARPVPFGVQDPEWVP